MYRRRILAGGGAAIGTALAGCVAPSSGSADASTEPLGEVSLPVPAADLRRALPRDAIRAVVDPAFGPDWEGITVTARDALSGSAYEIEPRLAPDDEVIGVVRDGEARAYPLRLLDYHEVVNDDFGGPLLVTFCPLCGSGVTAERRVNGSATEFGVSGLLWRNDLVMYDRATDSLWSQILGRAIRGPRTGEWLSLVPSTLTTLGGWREEHPDTTVLLPPPLSKTVGGPTVHDYRLDPYAGYDENGRLGVSGDDFGDDRLHPKARVLGVVADGTAVAYPYAAVAERGVVEDVVGETPVVVTAIGSADGRADAADGTVDGTGRGRGTIRAYVRRVGGETVRFAADGPTHFRGAGSRWSRLTGRAVDGPREGTVLDPATRRSPMFWFAWLEFRPHTAVYGIDR